MTKLTLIIRPARLDDVKEALFAWGVGGVTVAEVKDLSRHDAPTEIHRGQARGAGFAPRLQLEVVVPSPLVPRLLDAVTRAARTGKPGDGVVRVTPVEETIRIRTGERGEGAL